MCCANGGVWSKPADCESASKWALAAAVTADEVEDGSAPGVNPAPECGGKGGTIPLAAKAAAMAALIGGWEGWVPAAPE